MTLKILVKRDSVANFTANGFVPRVGELTSAYEADTEALVFKIGDGKTPWVDLPEITKISELSSFKVYTRYSSDKEAVEVLLNPFRINDCLKSYQIKEAL